jgi:hypothetical protein
MKTSHALLAAAVAGIFAGSGQATTSWSTRSTTEAQAQAPGKSDTQAGAIEKHACKGLNSCKGNGGCKVEGKNGCNGHNECKGKGGCATVKHSCKGTNACKAQGGCKVEGKNACKGQNTCKAQGGCKVG